MDGRMDECVDTFAPDDELKLGGHQRVQADVDQVEARFPQLGQQPS